jgi:hypothetical protein
MVVDATERIGKKVKLVGGRVARASMQRESDRARGEISNGG